MTLKPRGSYEKLSSMMIDLCGPLLGFEGDAIVKFLNFSHQINRQTFTPILKQNLKFSNIYLLVIFFWYGARCK